MITLNQVTLFRGTKQLFSAASISLYDKQKIGIVGKNGTGKTSLFLLLQGVLEANDGKILSFEHLKLVSIAQEIPSSDKSTQDYVIDADITLRAYQKALTAAQQNHDGMKIAELYEALRSIDGFTAEKRVTKILKGLGFSENEIKTPVNVLSGGWRMRLNIARALFVPSDVLLLDEPTNHLDLDAVIWLEKWLTRYSGLLLFISHDREFLDKVADHIVHIENKKIKLYSGNYSNFEKQRIALLAQQQRQHEKQQREIERIQTFIKRFKAKATKAKQAQSRIKALAKMQEIMPAHIDSPFSFEIKTSRQLSNPLLSLQNVSFFYEKAPILKHLNFQLRTQDRTALLGRNGAGKSTLIKLMAQEIIPTSGSFIRDHKLKIGYFAQHTLDRLDADRTPLENLQKLAKDKTQAALRAFLGGFGFSDDMALMPVKHLSGGEKSRLALALIVWEAPHVLLLDEPTNHLDLDMRQALILALQNYEGAVVLVSHDRFLLKQVIDQYWLIDHKQLQPFKGDVEDYKKYLLAKNDSEKSSKKLKPKNNRKQLTYIEKSLDKLKNQITLLDTEMATLSTQPIDHKRLKTLVKKRTLLVEQHNAFEEQWFQLLE